ncbi:MAG: thiamine-phosphate pyrophosphorylase [Candidatus Margulisbacteria bacterium]|nr:thiamine-phosphate pyrophosphorylase [Candidatus Margulisiibacteriota bacterium]
MKSKVERIIDANINRAVEGLRVMEEVARFVVEAKKMTEQLKKMRSRVRKLAKQFAGIKQRKALTDVGNKLYTKSEKKRKTIKDVVVANAKRVQEALRVLEEFSKLIKPSLGKSFKTIRFKVYDLEQKIYQALTAI